MRIVFVAADGGWSGVVGDSDGKPEIVRILQSVIVVGVGGERIQIGSCFFQDALF
jgi:hypothetical protein